MCGPREIEKELELTYIFRKKKNLKSTKNKTKQNTGANINNILNSNHIRRLFQDQTLLQLTSSTVLLHMDNLHCSFRLTWQREGFVCVFPN